MNDLTLKEIEALLEIIQDLLKEDQDNVLYKSLEEKIFNAYVKHMAW